MTWNYHDDDVSGPTASLRLSITGVPAGAKRVLLRHYRILERHEVASEPDTRAVCALESAGQLQLLESPQWISADRGKVELTFTLGGQAVSLVQLRW